VLAPSGANTNEGRTTLTDTGNASACASARPLDARNSSFAPGSAPRAEICTIRGTPASTAAWNSASGPFTCTASKLCFPFSRKMPTALTTVSTPRNRSTSAACAGGAV
jgi:hypothetical protein